MRDAQARVARESPRVSPLLARTTCSTLTGLTIGTGRRARWTITTSRSGQHLSGRSSRTDNMRLSEPQSLEGPAEMAATRSPISSSGTLRATSA